MLILYDNKYYAFLCCLHVVIYIHLVLSLFNHKCRTRFTGALSNLYTYMYV